MDIQQKLTAMSDQLADVVEQLTKLNVSNVGEQLAKLNESNAAIGRVLVIWRSLRVCSLGKETRGGRKRRFAADSACNPGYETSSSINLPAEYPLTPFSVAPDGVEKRVLTPKNILTAREEFVNQLVDFGHVTTNVLADAFAICSKPCNNVGCDQPHVSEDCPLEFMCRGCGQMGHVAQDCVEQCDRCGKWGHVYGRCTAKDKPGMPDPPAQLMPLLRPSWASERVVLPLVDRLMAEARLQASEV
ncbi:MAG: hypothetical protein L6R38_000476 [Xanthoria sp. 2 TBL-2021]|nr:MAG: hypothetical protein L6R38_000476 [Xanthoria sp. 2 TBL-2021]